MNEKTALLVIIITVISKILGFGREIVLSYVYGASAITDAYLISQTIPLTMFSFISSGVATGFIPMYSRIHKEDGQICANQFTSNLSNTLLLLASVIVVVVLVFTQPIVKLFASGFTSETLDIAVNFTRISIFGVYFTAILHVFTGYLRVHENYILPALIALPMNIIIIGSLFISTGTSINVIAVGSVIATASQLLILLPYIRRAGYHYKPVIDFKDEHLKTMVLIALPIIAGTSVNQINILIDRT
ncbi:MAG: murein biosynthesis integral membrane protein MurJ, partial [Clostridiales bacterium]|nr:murein biosynthesis integral membrane protein MurJ [Clostridiales bacterium]